MSEQPQRPWLLAAWPGMGNVAVVSAMYLVHKLGAKPVLEIPAGGLFDLQQIEVRKGLIPQPRLPRTILFRWTNPLGGRDLVILVGEFQPSHGAYAYAQELLERVAAMSVERVITFASLASQLHPSAEPRVFGAATDEDTLNQIRELKVRTLEDGQVGGLNGVMLAASMARGVSGLCLLGEIPFFAAAIPNAKAALAVLGVFSSLSGIDVDLGELAEQARDMEGALTDLMERMKQAAQEQGASAGTLAAFELQECREDDEEDSEEVAELEELAGEQAREQAGEQAADAAKSLDYATRERIERMFEDARKDRGKALQLKDELDRLRVFKQYEDRFLDLFKRAE